MRHRIRLHVDQLLHADAAVTLDSGQSHYLRSVMRRGPGDIVHLFNGRDGEWSAAVEQLDRRTVVLGVREQQRVQAPEPDIWLAFAPLKAARIDYLAQKAAELGVSRLIPVTTERTQVARVNIDRLRANAIEAAEQSERLTVPQVDAPVKLDDLLTNWPAARPLLAAVERGPTAILAEAVSGLSPPLGILIGPEGGFAPPELDALARCPNVKAVNLGPRILRAETAALAALAVVQALAGDWRTFRRDEPGKTT